VLASRIDRLEPLAKRILQACSVIGTPVPHELLVNVSAMGEDALDAGLRTLEEAELLFELRGYRDRAYRFKHALTQEATYRSLPKHTCTQLHALIAEILERRFDHIVATQPEALARHHAGAGNATAAVGYWQRAARKAYERSANVEAIGYAREGLDLLTSLASEDDRSQQELALQLTLAPALMAARGYGAAEVGPVYRRAQELCREIGDSRQLFRALVGLWNFHWVRGELETARDVAKQLLDLAQHAGDPARALRAHAATGEILFHLGDLEGSLRHLEKGISLYDAAPQRTYATQIPAVVCLSYAAWALWHLGYPERSLRRTEEAVALAEQLSHPMSLALSLTLKAELHQFQLQVVDCLTAAERALAVSRDLRLPFWEGTATTILGWAQAMAGDFDRGHRTLQAGLEIFIGTGARVQRTAWLGMLAEIRCHGERFEEGLDAVREALSWVGETGEQYYYSELLRLQGELLLGHDKIHGAAAAEKSFRSAIEVARRQGARMRELRAAVSLTRLLRDQGKTVSALALLQPVRSWLADAEGTIDAANARALMDSLS
jgi:predicted ATPase